MIRLRALGESIIEVGEHRVTPQSDVLFALLLYLSTYADSPVSRRALIELVWPECAPDRARHRLRQALYQLKALGVPLASRGDSVVLSRADVAVDYAAFQQPLDSRSVPCGPNVSFEILPEYAPALSEPYARWVEMERDRVQGAMRHALLTRLRERRGNASPSEIIDLARACLQLDPLNEEGTLALAEALALRGNGPDALAVIDLYSSELSAGGGGASAAIKTLRKRITDATVRIGVDGNPHSELFGRAAIVKTLLTWIEEGSASETRVIAFAGEAGIGKTRLLREGTRIAALRGRRCVDYRPSPNGGDRPLAGLLDLLPRLLALPGAVGCAPESFMRLSELARGVPGDTTIPEDTTDSVFRFATLRRSFLDLIDAVLAESNVVLVLDDAQWMDRPSIEILLDATTGIEHRLSVLMALRPTGEVAAFLGTRPEVHQVRVPPLDAASARRIVSGQLPPETVHRRSALIDWAVDLANGNPFFLVELSAHCRGDEPTPSLPESLQVALQRKLDALAPVARLLMQACATMGQNCSLARLERMLALPPHETALALSELEASGFLATDDGRIGCRHDLIAEEVISGLGPGVASYLHRRAAMTLAEEIRSSPTASVAWDCALHWAAAGEHARALELIGLISDQLLSLGLPRAAADLCRRSERYCKTAEQQAELLLRLSRASRLLDDWDGVIDALEKRRGLLANRSAGRERYSEDEIALFEARWWKDYDGRVLRPALERVVDQRAPALHRLQMAVIALIVADNHQRRREAQLIARHVDSIEPTSPREDSEQSRARLVYHTAFGNLDVAVAATERVVSIERDNGTSAALLQALRWSTIPLKYAGAVPRSFAAATEAFHVAERLGLVNEMSHAAYYLADLALDCEDVALARTWIPVCIELAEQIPTDTSNAAIIAYVRARAALMEDNLDQCRELADIVRQIRDPVLRTRFEESVIALEVLMHVRTGSELPRRASLQHFERLHRRTRWSGTRDFEVGALVLGLAHRGEVQRANDLYRRYVDELRRSRLAHHSVLREAKFALATDGPVPSSANGQARPHREKLARPRIGEN